MKHVVQYAMESKLTIYDETRSIAHTFLSKRECGVKECAFHILSEQRLKETNSLVTFEISNISEKRFRICLSEDDSSTNEFKWNRLDRCIDRPNWSYANEKYLVLDSFCYLELLR